MPGYTYVLRNGTGFKTQRYLVWRDSYDAARADRPQWMKDNPFWAVTAIEPATLEDFAVALRDHDWYHEMSDDYRAHRAGAARYEELRRVAESLGPEAQTMLQEYPKTLRT